MLGVGHGLCLFTDTVCHLGVRQNALGEGHNVASKVVEQWTKASTKTSRTR